MQQPYPISARIKTLRQSRGLTQSEFAKILNVKQQAVSLWETGTTYPDISVIYEINRIFNVSFDDLMSYDGKIKPRLKIKRVSRKRKCCEFAGPALDALDNDDMDFVKTTIEFLAKRKEKLRR